MTNNRPTMPKYPILTASGNFCARRFGPPGTMSRDPIRPGVHRSVNFWELAPTRPQRVEGTPASDASKQPSPPANGQLLSTSANPTPSGNPKTKPPLFKAPTSVYSRQPPPEPA